MSSDMQAKRAETACLITWSLVVASQEFADAPAEIWLPPQVFTVDVGKRPKSNTKAKQTPVQGKGCCRSSRTRMRPVRSAKLLIDYSDSGLDTSLDMSGHDEALPACILLHCRLAIGGRGHPLLPNHTENEVSSSCSSISNMFQPSLRSFAEENESHQPQALKGNLKGSRLQVPGSS